MTPTNLPDDPHLQSARPRKGELTPDTPMGAALAADPNLPVLLMRYHIGGCSMCGFEPDHTIRQVAEDNGVPTARLLAAING